MISRLFANGFHVALMMTLIPGVSSTLMYQLQVRQVYAPENALDEIETSALTYLHEIFAYAPTFEALGAGQICPDCATFDDDAFTDDYYYYVRRHDRQLQSTGDSPEEEDQGERRTEEEDQGDQRTEEEDQGERRTAGIPCPSSCTNSGRRKCRVLGCAYCGRSCARRRSLQTGGLTPTQAKYIEIAINRKLRPYCEDNVECKIKALLFRQNPDGTLTQVRYETV